MHGCLCVNTRTQIFFELFFSKYLQINLMKNMNNVGKFTCKTTNSSVRTPLKINSIKKETSVIVQVGNVL